MNNATGYPSKKDLEHFMAPSKPRSLAISKTLALAEPDPVPFLTSWILTYLNRNLL